MTFRIITADVMEGLAQLPDEFVHQRNAIGIELNPTYAEMSIARLSKDRGGLLDFIDQPEQPKPKQLDLLLEAS